MAKSVLHSNFPSQVVSDLEKMSQQPNDYAQFLNKVYVA